MFASLLLAVLPFQLPEPTQETVAKELEKMIERTAAAKTVYFDFTCDLPKREGRIPPFRVIFAHEAPDRYAVRVWRTEEQGTPFSLAIWADRSGATFRGSGLPFAAHGELAWSELEPWASEAESWRRGVEALTGMDPMTAVRGLSEPELAELGNDLRPRFMPTFLLLENRRWHFGVSYQLSDQPASLCFWLYSLRPLESWEIEAEEGELRFKKNEGTFTVDRATWVLESVDGMTSSGESARFIQFHEGWINRELPVGWFDPPPPPETSSDRSQWLLTARDLGELLLARQRWYAHYLNEMMNKEELPDGFEERAKVSFRSLYEPGLRKCIEVGLLPLMEESLQAWVRALPPYHSEAAQAKLEELRESVREERECFSNITSTAVRQQWYFLRPYLPGGRSEEFTEAVEGLPWDTERELLTLEREVMNEVSKQLVLDLLERHRAEHEEF